VVVVDSGDPAVLPTNCMPFERAIDGIEILDEDTLRAHWVP
jgi:hypothetical protein